MENNKLLIIKDKLLEYGKFRHSDIDEKDTKGKIEDPNKHPLEFMFGVILDQGIKYERAWSGPFELAKRLGHLDVKRIAEMDAKELEMVMFKKADSDGNPLPALHRYRYMARRLIEASKLILEKYDGTASKIWKDRVPAKELESRFREFKQVGQKKASMAVNILVRDFGIQIIGDRSGIDVSNDVHVRRVFHRTGLIIRDNERAVVEAARKLNSDYPGELDYPAWVIGMKYCKSGNPNCKDCPLNEVCPKILT